MLICYDLFAGLYGWGEAFLAEGFEVIGYDIVDMAKEIGRERMPGLKLVLRDVLTIHGSEFADATCIVASPPCQAYSYRAMPWKRAKALPPPDNTLFEACFRIQREACEAAGRHIPMVVENVRGAEKWVGAAKWHWGSQYLWGDVPALMPPGRVLKLNGGDTHRWEKTGKHCGNWSTLAMRKATESSAGFSRKAASAQIAKIPYPLASHIARVFKQQAESR